MTFGRKRPPPADMLLLAARQKQMQAAARNASLGDEILAAEEDELVESLSSQPRPALDQDDSVTLFRPIDQIHLARIGWSGPIDHDALQTAIVCCAADGLSAAQLGIEELPDQGSRHSAPALEVALAPADLSLWAALADKRGADAAGVFRALRLPERITGTVSPTIAAVNPVLAAYRRCALEYAWQSLMALHESAQFQRDRDEAAVAVLSTLRALLGER